MREQNHDKGGNRTESDAAERKPDSRNPDRLDHAGKRRPLLADRLHRSQGQDECGSQQWQRDCRYSHSLKPDGLEKHGAKGSAHGVGNVHGRAYPGKNRASVVRPGPDDAPGGRAGDDKTFPGSENASPDKEHGH